MERTENPADFHRQVQKMFSDIAPRYDFLNRLLSGGQDRYWRKRAVNRLSPKEGERFLDIATGTADVALEITRNFPQGSVQVVGMDFSDKMLELARQKIDALDKAASIQLRNGSAEDLPFEDNSFEGTTTAFGVRNFSDVDRSLREMHRVLKPGGRCVILEFALPRNAFLNSLYRIYFEWLLPRIGRLVSRHPSAYTYLPQSVASFPIRNEFSILMEQAGFKNVTFKELTFGIVILYTGLK
ncbi:MAG: bifunctional demethylmenaquinone methyltransferase/2-methoxy-6-polyprenyl-1,4-benzoquinol methylase UbiE [Nitrospinota bacterium]|nr:bifunctional demethylmenaquinone methyltransferase/2-methoxy-6-polyprenyl-1,4-benzoquinol methylase UbiE [Nitrospinota bacterium]